MRRLTALLHLLVVLASLGLAPAAQAVSQAAIQHAAPSESTPHAEAPHHPTPAVQDGDHCHPGIDCIGQTPTLSGGSGVMPASPAAAPFRQRPRQLGGIAPGSDPPVPRT